MRRALVPALIALGAAFAAAPVCAQSQPAGSTQSGLRRLDWAGKPKGAPAAEAPPTAPPSGARPTAPRTVAPNRYSSRSGPVEAGRVWNPFPAEATMADLRPAPAEVQRRPEARPAPQPVQPAALPYRPVQPSAALPSQAQATPPAAPRPAPAAPARPEPRPAAAALPAAPMRPAPTPVAAAPAANVVRDSADAPPRAYSEFSRPMSAPAPVQAAPATTPPAPAAPLQAAEVPDMAPPRSYADFSKPMTAQPAAPPRGEAPRYYSVHREYGRQPEQPAIPEAFFIDSVGGEDLAAPPEPLMSERDERRARAAAADPDAPASSQ